MSRPRGGFIGHNPAPAATAINSAAGGIWTLREAEELKRAGTWPIVVPLLPTISGLQLHLDASDASTLYDATTGGSLVAADGGVARWEDKSGNDRHATQGTAGYRPTRKTAVQGGRDVVRLDGSDDFLSLSSYTIPSSYSAFFVFTRPTQGTHSILVGNDEALSASNRYFSWWFSDNIIYSKSNADFSTHGSASTSTGAFVVSDIRNATTSVSTRRNGSSLATVTTGNAITNAVSGSLNTVGRSQAAIMSGDICEIIIYNAALSDTDRDAVENYLIAKWGIS